jgi:hypothetical protein
MDTPHTDDQQAEFKAAFARRRTRHIAGFAAAIASILLVVLLPESRLTYPFGPGTPPLPFIVGPLFIISTWINWRCPACSHTLGGELSPRYCSACGIPLQS